MYFIKCLKTYKTSWSLNYKQKPLCIKSRVSMRLYTLHRPKYFLHRDTYDLNVCIRRRNNKSSTNGDECMLRNFWKSRSQVNGFHVGRFKLIYKLGPMAGCGVSRGVGLGVGVGGLSIMRCRLVTCAISGSIWSRGLKYVCFFTTLYSDTQLNSSTLVAVLCGTLCGRKYIPTKVQQQY